jgi:hypothetical protein
MKVKIALGLLCLAACSYSVWRDIANCDYYPLWNASRALLNGIDPYSPEITAQNRAHATESRLANSKDEERFAYPLFATIPVLPLGLLPFRVADGTIFVLFIAIVISSVGWMREKWDSRTALYCVLAFTTYPVLYSLRLRQPTILFLGMGVASYCLARSGRLISSGVLLALMFGKPQLALAFALPLTIWTAAYWNKRQKFVWSLGGTLAGMAFISVLIHPAWVSEWVDTVRHYTTYNNPPILTDLFGARAAAILIAVISVALVMYLWRRRARALLEQLSVCILVLQWITPCALHNQTALLIPCFYLATLAPAKGMRQSTRALVLVALVELWLIGGIGVLMAQRFTFALLIALSGAMIAEAFYEDPCEESPTELLKEAGVIWSSASR